MSLIILQSVQPQWLIRAQLAALSLSTIIPTSGTREEVSSITLPNGDAYSFTYDPVYGLLNKITYPSGAYVSYVWGPSYSPSDWINYEGAGTWVGLGQYIPPNLSCFAQYNAISILQRNVSFDGVNIAQQQSFNYLTTWDFESVSRFGANLWLWNSKTTTVTTTDFLRAGTPSYQTIYTYSPVVVPTGPNDSSIAHNEIPVENTITYKDWNGATLQTITKTWVDPYTSVLSSEQTSLGNGQVSLTNYFYAGSGSAMFPVMTEKDEYGYGAGVHGGLARKTVTNYAAFSNTALSTSLGNLPCQSIVYDGNGNRIAETDTLYDGGATVCGTAGTPSVTAVSGMPSGTHDETNFSASSVWPRGNPTKVTRKCFTGSASCTDATTSYTYDETGQILSATDPCGNSSCSDIVFGTGHSTSYSYADNYASGTPSGNTNTYIYSITKPTVNSVSSQTVFSYYLADGQLASMTDENSNPTNYTYGGPFDRLSLVQGPPSSDNGNQRPTQSISYNDDNDLTPPFNPTVTTMTLLNSSGTNVTNISEHDPLGHSIETQVSSDPAGADNVVTTYDGEGKVYTKTVPFRGSTAPSGITTTYYYDSLGRATYQVQADGTYRMWCYNNISSLTPMNISATSCQTHLGSVATGTWVHYSDENGNRWQRTTDAFGNLIVVMEPNGSSQIPSMETDYTYDPGTIY